MVMKKIKNVCIIILTIICILSIWELYFRIRLLYENDSFFDEDAIAVYKSQSIIFFICIIVLCILLIIFIILFVNNKNNRRNKMRSKIIILLYFIIFIGCNNNISLNKQKSFSSRGFGIDISINTVNDIQKFIDNYGQPIEYSEEIINWGSIDRYIEVTLEYNNFYIIFYKDNINENLKEIKSKDNIEYMFGIKHNMHIKDLENIFGKLFKYNNNVYVSGFIFEDAVGAKIQRYTEIELKGDKINSIRWWIYSQPK
jgi:hypothetical protein